MKSVVETVVNTADINRLDKDIYIYLYFKYKEKMEKNFLGPTKIIEEIKEDDEFKKMQEDSKSKLIEALLNLKII